MNKEALLIHILCVFLIILILRHDNPGPAGEHQLRGEDRPGGEAHTRTVRGGDTSPLDGGELSSGAEGAQGTNKI